MFLYLARHGQSEANVLRVFSNKPGKHGLTELGRDQAAQLAVRMADHPVQRIFCSPILRAIQTAEIVAQKLGLDFQIEPALAEFSVGDWEGESGEIFWQEHRKLFERWLVQKDYLAANGGGDNYFDIKNRYQPFIYSLVSGNSVGGDTLLIGHGGTTRAMLPILTPDILPEEAMDLRYPNTAIITLEWSGSFFRIISME